MTGEVFGKADFVGAGMSGPSDAQALGEFRREAAVDLISRHERTLRRTARRYSICADDAEDAYQRALEILLTKAPPIEGESLIRWMQTVTKREALGVRRQRVRMVGSPPPATDDPDSYDPFEMIASDIPEPDEKAARAERVHRSSEALRALKPQEVRALILKAEGYSYEEIQQITGWTYTKVNRCMAEGRKRFLGVFADIESGERCEKWEEGLSRVADGEPHGDDLIEVRIHLRTCAICRARLREYRRVPRRVLGLGLPLPSLAVVDWLDSRSSVVADRFKSLTATASRVADSVSERTFSLAAAGGTRGTGSVALAKLLAVCGMAAAGSAACAVSGVIPEPTSTAAQARAAGPVPPVLPSQAPDVANTYQPDTAGVSQAGDSPPTPVDQSTDQFSFEGPSATAPVSAVETLPRKPAVQQPQFGFEK